MQRAGRGALATVLALIVWTGSVAATEEPRGSWVFFHPRPESATTTPALSARALARLRLAGCRVEIADRPLHLPWIAELEAGGIRPRSRSRWLNAVSAELTPDQRAWVATLPFVARVSDVPAGRAPAWRVELREREAAARRTASGAILPLTPADYGATFHQLAMLGVPDLHAAGLSGAGVLIASLDSGFHHDLAVFESLAVVAQRDFVSGDGDVQNGDANDRHGTLTLSTLAGRLPGDLVGPAYGAQVALARTEEVTWERRVEIDHFIAGLEWADSLGADIVTASLGYLDFPDDDPPYTFPPDSVTGGATTISRAVNRMARRGMLVVLSAGNEGPGSGTLLLPADSDSGLAVGAITPWGDVRTTSSRGPVWNWDGQRYKPDLCALGEAVTAVAWSPQTGGFLTEASGTSLAAPLIAGLAALLIEGREAAGLTSLRGQPLALIEALHAAGDRADQPDHAHGWGVPWGPLALDAQAPALVVEEVRWLLPAAVGGSYRLELRVANRGGEESGAALVSIASRTVGSVAEAGERSLAPLASGESGWAGPWAIELGTTVPGGGRSWVELSVAMAGEAAFGHRSLWAEVDLPEPAAAALLGVQPQPWNPKTLLQIDLTCRTCGPLRVRLLDLTGRVVGSAEGSPIYRPDRATLLLPAGSWPAAPTGIYRLLLDIDGRTWTAPLLLIR